MGPTVPLPLLRVSAKYTSIARCTNRNQFDILMTAVADVRKGQTNMPYKGEQLTITKKSMIYQDCPGETLTRPL